MSAATCSSISVANKLRNLAYRGPDFFFVNGGVTRTPIRPYWAIWNERGRTPDVIIELLSPTTKETDLTIKKDIYEKTLKTHEYYCYDPDTQELRGWRLVSNSFQPIAPNEKGWLLSEELGLWLGTWMGSYSNYSMVWLRFYDATGKVVPTLGEAAEAMAAAEEKRAEEAEQRARALEAEIAALRSQLASRTPPTS